MPLDETMFNLLKSNEVSTKVVFFKDQQVNTVDVQSLIEALKDNQVPIELYLDNNELDEIDLQMLISALKDNRTLIALNLINNQLTNLSIEAMVEMLQANGTIRNLGLWNNQITDTGIETLAAMLKENSNLEKFSLGINLVVADSTIQTLLTSLQFNHHLNALHLKNIPLVTAQAQKGLIEILSHSSSLTSLSLHNTQLGVNGVRVLAQGLENNRILRDFSSVNNQIGNTGAEILAVALKNNKSLTSFYSQDDQIEAVGVQALKEMLENNYSLTKLFIINFIGFHFEIRKLLERNKKLEGKFIAAVKKGQVSQMEYLLLNKSRSLVHSKDKQDNTPLHWAAQQGSYQLVQFLINYGANNQAINCAGKTAWQMAENTLIAVLVDEIKPQQIPSLKGFCLFKVKQLQSNSDLLPKEQQQSFAEQVASLPAELKTRLS